MILLAFGQKEYVNYIFYWFDKNPRWPPQQNTIFRDLSMFTTYYIYSEDKTHDCWYFYSLE